MNIYIYEHFDYQTPEVNYLKSDHMLRIGNSPAALGLSFRNYEMNNFHQIRHHILYFLNIESTIVDILNPGAILPVSHRIFFIRNRGSPCSSARRDTRPIFLR